jgi:ABC-type methionine transport system ATPase subunit
VARNSSSTRAQAPLSKDSTNGTAISTCCATSTSTSRKGERIVICGPSGSGKSTLIRCINRLEEHQKGKIVVDGIELTNDLQARSTRSAAKSAWCSSTSTCSRI